jgi:murein DD-endopeptidase MepM/ murein hydrolase activator NlpD
MNLLKPFKKAFLSTISTYYSPTHKATDWYKKYGEPLVAPENAVVTRIRGNQYAPFEDIELAKGYVLEMTGESGFKHEYWHIMPFLAVTLGDQVKRGQIVAYMGNSGNVLSDGRYIPLPERSKSPYLGTHLHQNLIKDGEYLDPVLYMDLNEEPQYTALDTLTAIAKVIWNVNQVVSGKT